MNRLNAIHTALSFESLNMSESYKPLVLVIGVTGRTGGGIMNGILATDNFVSHTDFDFHSSFIPDRDLVSGVLS